MLVFSTVTSAAVFSAVTSAAVVVVVAVCKLVFGLVALRGVKGDERVDAIKAIGTAWQGWGPLSPFRRTDSS